MLPVNSICSITPSGYKNSSTPMACVISSTDMIEIIDLFIVYF